MNENGRNKEFTGGNVSFALEPGEEIIRADGTVGSEAGEFLLWIGDGSETENMARFYLEGDLAG